MEARNEKNSNAEAGAASVTNGSRRAIGATRTNAAVPAIGFVGASHARIEQSFRPPVPIALHKPLSFCGSFDWRWCSGQYIVLQHAGKSAAESVSASAETHGRRSATRAAMAANLRATSRNWGRAPFTLTREA